MGEAEAPSPTAALPKPTEADVALPDLAVLEVNKLLHVSGFTKLCLGWFQSFSLGVCFLVVFQLLFGSVRLASNTEATRPIFLRKHLLDVHKVAVDVLSASVEEDAKRLVSLVGCPGTGKTWCGWLVAHALQERGKRTLHVTIRGNEVIVVSEFKKKKSYEIADLELLHAEASPDGEPVRCLHHRCGEQDPRRIQLHFSRCAHHSGKQR